MISGNISRQHLLAALARLDRDGYDERVKSTKFDLVHEGKRYPPKQVVRVASEIAGFPVDVFYGGPETNGFLRSRGFVVVGKDGTLLATRPQEEDDEVAFPEGAQIYRRHLARERSAKAVKIAKEQRMREAGDLRCDVCAFSFVQAYGEHGAGFIEAHHNVPLSTSKSTVETRASDLALVCSNCHRMLHRCQPWLSVEELRKSLLRTG
jgi:hypothetical protein